MCLCHLAPVKRGRGICRRRRRRRCRRRHRQQQSNYKIIITVFAATARCSRCDSCCVAVAGDCDCAAVWPGARVQSRAERAREPRMGHANCMLRCSSDDDDAVAFVARRTSALAQRRLFALHKYNVNTFSLRAAVLGSACAGAVNGFHVPTAAIAAAAE